MLESSREGRKVRHKILEYYGTQDPGEIKKVEKIEPANFSKVKVDRVYTAGPILCLLKLIEEYGVCRHIDRAVSKRQGIPIGITLFLVSLHKLFGFNPSLNNLSNWLEDSPLKITEDIDISKFSCDTVNNLGNVKSFL
ncbi:MAG: hypothetical protein GY820_30585 [Gammaproteobacteria bacterium]|nr:hypothetical protein [Gammaproteobacteria bacterium]